MGTVAWGCLVWGHLINNYATLLIHKVTNICYLQWRWWWPQWGHSGLCSRRCPPQWRISPWWRSRTLPARSPCLWWPAWLTDWISSDLTRLDRLIPLSRLCLCSCWYRRYVEVPPWCCTLCQSWCFYLRRLPSLAAPEQRHYISDNSALARIILVQAYNNLN